MILNEEKVNHIDCITSYDENSVCIGGKLYTQSIIITPKRIIKPWIQKKIDQLSPQDFYGFLDMSSDFIIFGTGIKHHLLPSNITKELNDKNLYIETMDNGACCRAFRILSEEKRRFLTILTIEKYQEK